MTTLGTDAFLRAEEEAHQLVETLRRLRNETESYMTARVALGQAAGSVGELSAQCARAAERLGGLAETIRSIGMPELLRRLEAISAELASIQVRLVQHNDALQKETQALHKDLAALRESVGLQLDSAKTLVVNTLQQVMEEQREVYRLHMTALQERVGAQGEDTKNLLLKVRKLASVGVALSLFACALLGWIARALAGG